jgi:hypothetical protein
MAALVTMLSFTGRLVFCIKVERRTWVGSKAGEQDVIAVSLTVKTGACREKFSRLAFFWHSFCAREDDANVSLGAANAVGIRTRTRADGSPVR